MTAKNTSSEPKKLPGKSQHGTTGYGLGCRCEVCVKANHEVYVRCRDKKKQKAAIERMMKIATQPIEIEIDGVIHHR